jgi:receptor-type tyrosine-protein phosphatase gamma
MAQMFRSFKSIFRPFEHRKCFHSNYYYLDDPNQSQSSSPSVDLDAPINDVNGEVHYPVNVEDFGKHVAQLHADGDIGFSREYEVIQNESIIEEHSSEFSQHSDNKAKNRYLNIIACKWKFCVCVGVCA